MNTIPKQPRILAVSLSTRGFGYAVTEGENMIVDCGKKRIYGDKNAGSLACIEKMVAHYQPCFIVLQDVNAKGIRRNKRIKRLHQKVVTLAVEYKLKAVEISGKELRATLLGNEDGTKHEMAELLAQRFPDELASRLPPKRTAWMTADDRMDIFDAVGLAVVFRMREK
jgi:hypothetical protein